MKKVAIAVLATALRNTIDLTAMLVIFSVVDWWFGTTIASQPVAYLVNFFIWLSVERFQKVMIQQENK